MYTESLESLGGIFGAVLGVMIVILGVLLVVGVILYVLQGRGLSKMGKKKGLGGLSNVAWIPGASFYVMFKIIEDDIEHELGKYLGVIYLVLFGVTLLIGSKIPYIEVVSFAYILFGYYHLMKKYTESAVVHVIVGVITAGVSIPITIFVFRNKEYLDENVQTIIE